VGHRTSGEYLRATSRRHAIHLERGLLPRRSPPSGPVVRVINAFVEKPAEFASSKTGACVHEMLYAQRRTRARTAPRTE
jgi:hypothetical protein